MFRRTAATIRPSAHSAPAPPQQPLTCRASSKEEMEGWIDALMAPMVELAQPNGGPTSSRSGGEGAGVSLGSRKDDADDDDDDEDEEDEE